MSNVRKRSILIAGHKTSVSLEEPFWEELASIALAGGQSVSALIEDIDRNRSGNLSSAIRLHVLDNLRQRSRP